MIWAGRVARLGEKTVFWLGNEREKYHLKELVVDGTILNVKLIKKQDWYSSGPG
jgi:hypothetical protein